MHVTAGDLNRLEEDSINLFLNDNLVDFYLRFMQKECRVIPSPQRAVGEEGSSDRGLNPATLSKGAYVFSSHFYKKLTEEGRTATAAAASISHRGKRRSAALSSSSPSSASSSEFGSGRGAAGYGMAARWAKRVEPFSKRYRRKGQGRGRGMGQDLANLRAVPFFDFPLWWWGC